jgi:hypothetical protein
MHGMLFFRITSDLVPFASHPVCTFPWQEEFAEVFEKIGNYLRQFLKETRPLDFDLMPGIKDKEKSVLEALTLARDDPRLVAAHPADA